MRRAVSSFVMLFTAAACGAFGTKDDSTPSTPPPNTPDQNAQPPIDGAPLIGIFASSSKGAVDGDGSMAKPYKTLKDAIALAKSSGQRVIACAEEFDEAIEVVDGVSMYGYYDCGVSPWARVTKVATVKSPTSPAIKVENTMMATRIDGFEVFAPDLDATPYTDPAQASSIGLYANNASDIVFGGCIIHAGKAAPGPAGVDPAPNVEQSTTHNGPNASSQASRVPVCSKLICFKEAPPGGTSSCKVGASGGPGGVGGPQLYAGSGSDCAANAGPSENVSGYPIPGTGPTAQGGANRAAGSDGSHGNIGGNGMNGVLSTASWSAIGFIPADGTKATDGGAGQGGGGGGGDNDWVIDAAGDYGRPPDPPPVGQTTLYPTYTESGASGGAGGCAGLAGTPGKGGGASIGAFIAESHVSFETTSVTASVGGVGGLGARGTAGLPGGTGGLVTSGFAGKGGKGGDGGPGGISGTGASGPSYGLVYSGEHPKTDAQTTFTQGQGGAAQPAQSKIGPAGPIALQGTIAGPAASEFQF